MKRSLKITLPEPMKPETFAYAGAMVSRSNKPFEDRVAQVREKEASDKARDFFKTFYFNYGHASIGDMASVPMAIENLSILAAIELEYEQQWAGQEQSTRYQDFSKDFSYYLPYYEPQFDSVMEAMAADYTSVTAALLQHLRDEAYDEDGILRHPARGRDKVWVGNYSVHKRVFESRVFDVTRAMLPLATHTRVVQVNSARNLDLQIERLKANNMPEVRQLGAAMYDHALFDEEAGVSHMIHAEDTYTDYGRQREDTMAKEVFKIVRGFVPSRPQWGVNVFKRQAVETELVASTLFKYAPIPYAECIAITRQLPAATRARLASQWASRFNAMRYSTMLQLGAPYTAEFTMDIGSLRDLYRHRRMTQVRQETFFSDIPSVEDWLRLGIADFGFTVPLGLQERLEAYFSKVQDTAELVERTWWNGRMVAPYILPLMSMRRAVFKMDYAQLQYIIKLRSRPASHFSYRAAIKALHQGVKPLLPKSLYSEIQVAESDIADFFQR